MQKIITNTRHLLMTGLILLFGSFTIVHAQDQKWIRVGETQCFFMDFGAEPQDTGPEGANYLTWPTQYGDEQDVVRMKGLWLGAKNFYDTVEGKVKSIKVIGAGPRQPDNQFNMIFPQSIKLIGRYYHPAVVVDNATGTSNILYDQLDELDPNLPCDRMVVSNFNTSIGVSVTRRIMGFMQPDHDDYFIHEFIFKNSGIINEAGDEYHQTLNDFYVYFSTRPAFAGVTASGWGSSNWGSDASEWGTSNLLRHFDYDSPEGMRGYYGWYGPTNSYSHPLTPEEDWGCPDWGVTGILGSAKYIGAVVLFASESPQKYWTDDPDQPATNAYIGSDGGVTEANVSQYNEIYMQQRYNIMTEGKLDHSQYDAYLAATGGGYVEDWTTGNSYRGTGTTGGSSQGLGFGPYTLESGDSIRIVFAEGVNGISWPKGREIGARWLQYYRGEGTPELIMPDGSTASEVNEYDYAAYNAYKRAWCETGVDSIFKVLNHAISMYQYLYENGEPIPQGPPAPETFTVQSGGDRIRLTWADNAVGTEGFNGYVITRSEGSVKDYRTVYEVVKEFDGPNPPHEWDDVTAVRGFDYFYAIQSKTDGSNNNGKPVYSSLFLTLTSVPAHLQRPAVPETPSTPDADNTSWKIMSDKGVWISGSNYSQFDAVSYNSLTYVCINSVSGDSETITPDINTVHWRETILKGEWVSGNGYNAYDIVTYNGFTYVCLTTIPAGIGLELVRVVPNPYNIRARAFQYGEDFQVDRISFFGLPGVCTVKVFTERGDLIYEKYHDDGSGDEIWNSLTSSGQIVVSGIYILYVETPDGRSVIRKFVVIR